MHSKTWISIGVVLIVLGAVGLTVWYFMRSKADEEILNCPVAALYSDPNFNTDMGAGGCFGVGSYNLTTLINYDLAGTASGAGAISSVQVKSGYKVTLYKGDNFTSDSVVLTTDTPNLATKGFDNVTSSVQIASLAESAEASEKLDCKTVAVYSHSNYGEMGAAGCFPIGNYTLSNLIKSDLAGSDDAAISAVTVASGYQVTLYKSDNFTGESIVLTTDVPTLRTKNFNNVTKSMKIAKVEVSSESEETNATTATDNTTPTTSNSTTTPTTTASTLTPSDTRDTTALEDETTTTPASTASSSDEDTLTQESRNLVIPIATGSAILLGIVICIIGLIRRRTKNIQPQI